MKKILFEKLTLSQILWLAFFSAFFTGFAVKAGLSAVLSILAGVALYFIFSLVFRRGFDNIRFNLVWSTLFSVIGYLILKFILKQ